MNALINLPMNFFRSHESVLEMLVQIIYTIAPGVIITGLCTALYLIIQIPVKQIRHPDVTKAARNCTIALIFTIIPMYVLLGQISNVTLAPNALSWLFTVLFVCTVINLYMNWNFFYQIFNVLYNKSVLYFKKVQ